MADGAALRISIGSKVLSNCGDTLLISKKPELTEADSEEGGPLSGDSVHELN